MRIPLANPKKRMRMYPPHHEKIDASEKVLAHFKYEAERFIEKYIKGFTYQ